LESISNDDKPYETLRLKGAIYKRKYSFYKDIDDLYRAIECYEEAAKNDINDDGYGAGNAVYLYFLLISKMRDRISQYIKIDYQKRAYDIANKALDRLNHKKGWESWDYASATNLYLSLGDFKNAKKMLSEYRKREGEKFTRTHFVTVETIIKLFDVLPCRYPDSYLYELLSVYDNSSYLIKSIRRGKIGLALSGGGFRASLYHIGTLFYLAEIDMLRYVEVISTVSGGSIIGVYYYLQLKKLLEDRENSELTREDYINLVEDVANNFLKKIEINNFRMESFIKKISQNLTESMIDEFQEKFYDNRLMKELKISPKIDGKKIKDFNPSFQNIEINNKVPRLIINATLLNNGHNWQFTVEGMGESEYMYDEHIDKNLSYPFISYENICGDIRVGDAVVASAAVPMIFDPVEFYITNDECKYLNPKGKKVRLCDGGVYDNLGLASIVNDECKYIIISDGSKQLRDTFYPSHFRFDILNRTQDILMTKNRDIEYRYAKELERVGVVESVIVSHMRDECLEGDLRELFEKVSNIRTDLDSFNEIESYAIIYTGYKIAFKAFECKSKHTSGYEIINSFENYYEKHQEEVINKLSISSKTLFKIYDIVKLKIKNFEIFAVVVLLTILIVSKQFILSVIFLSVITALYNRNFLKKIFNKIFEFILKYISKIYIKFFNSKYIAYGKFREDTTIDENRKKSKRR